MTGRQQIPVCYMEFYFWSRLGGCRHQNIISDCPLLAIPLVDLVYLAGTHRRSSNTSKLGGCRLSTACNASKLGGCRLSTACNTSKLGGCRLSTACNTSKLGGCRLSTACNTSKLGGCRLSTACNTSELKQYKLFSSERIINILDSCLSDNCMFTKGVWRSSDNSHFYLKSPNTFCERTMSIRIDPLGCHKQLI